MAKRPKSKIIMQERERWRLFGLPFTFTVYSITDKKLIIKKGFINRQFDEVLLYRITDLQMSRSFGQLVFGFGLGSLKVFSKDTTDSMLEIKNIRRYKEFYDCLSESLERERLRYGVRASELIGGMGDHHGHGDIDLDGDGIPDDVADFS